tara:strand:+ start:366 stop:944 length:579 start_codon:yes stop_codon:yes gene_type:complete
MPMSTDVRLPREQEPVFPPQCCRCLAEDPEHRVRFSASRFSWAQVFFVWVWLFRKSIKHEVPACGACRGPMRRRKWLELLAFVGVGVLAMSIVIPWVQSMGLNRQWRKLVGIGVAIVIAIPYIIWCVIRPPAFDMTVKEDYVEYEFANGIYARRFAECNSGAMSDDIFVADDFEGDDPVAERDQRGGADARH